MNAIDLLKNDHDYVDMLFGRIEDTPPSRHAAIFKQIKGELETHAHIEETIFYPTAKEKGDKELKDIVMEAFEEHKQMKMFLADVARARSTDKREAQLKVLIEDTRHHVKEEENELFPLVEDRLSSDQLEKLGAKMEREKIKFQEANGIPQRREEPQGAFTRVIEKARAVVESVIGGSSDDGKKGSASKSNGRSKKKIITAPSAKRIGQVRTVNADGGSKATNGKSAPQAKSKNTRSKPASASSRSKAAGSKAKSSTERKGGGSRTSASR